MGITIGCHLSAANGFLAMGKTAAKIGANTFAFFTRNPQGGKAKAIDSADAVALCDFLAQNNFGTLVSHAPYTMNLCSDKESIRQFALEMLTDDLKRMEYTPHQYYNFHPGSHMKQGAEFAIPVIADALNRAMFEGQTTTVLLETMAGKGTEVGRSFEEIRAIIDLVSRKDKIGVCLDTCHIFDAGYDIKGNLDGVLEDFDRIIGLSYLKAVHLNDSKNPFASHKDRHEKIGAGALGTETFAKIINHAALKNVPFILETPNELDGYAAEIALLKSMVK